MRFSPIKLVPFLVLALAIFALTGQDARADPITPRLRDLLNAMPSDEEVSVIVTFSSKVNPGTFKRLSKRNRRRMLVEALRDKSDATQSGAKAFLQGRGGRRIKVLWIRNALAVTAPAEVIEELETWPGIESVRLDSVLEAPQPTLSAASLPEWNLETIRAPELWNLGFTGQGVVVANMDTGVDLQHADLQNSWRGGTNSWFDPHGVYDTPHDVNGHGTQTMGLMLGGDATGTAIGVAPGAEWIAVKIFDDNDQANLSDIELGFQWLLDPDGDPLTNDAPDIVNNSWGFLGTEGQCDSVLLQDIRTLKAADIAVVFAAGNAGPGTLTGGSPANYPESLSIGAVDDSFDPGVAYFSSQGPSACDGGIFPRLVAPGVNIKTADLTFGFNSNAYNFVAGTSYASPHSAGAMALLLDAFPGTSVQELEFALEQTAVDLGEVGPDDSAGFGLLDVAAAYDLIGAAGTGDPDADGDGVLASEDCDDSDPLVHPGATEIRSDGIDQDCNGFDLTIRVTKARYIVAKDRLIVFADSALGENARLRVRVTLRDGTRFTRRMAWNSVKGRWQRRFGRFAARFGSRPKSVRVRGLEGSVDKSVAVIR